MQYIGEYEHQVDSKSRLAIPARWRSNMDEKGIVVARGIDRCLVIYDRDSWEIRSQRLINIDEESELDRRRRRLYLGQANDQKLDTQGRALLPEKLREYGSIVPGSTVALVGVGDHIEIWNSELYAAEMEQLTTQTLSTPALDLES